MLTMYLVDKEGSKITKAYRIEEIKDIGKRAFLNVCVEEGVNIPDGEKDYLERGCSNSDKELFEAMKMLIRNGMALEKSLI